MDTHEVMPAASATSLETELAQLFSDAPIQHIEPGEWLLHAGEPSDEVYLITRGSFDVVLMDDQRRRHTLARLTPNSIFGEISFLLGGTRSAGVVARQRSEVKVLSTSQTSLSADQYRTLAKVLAARLRSTGNLLQDLLLDADEPQYLPSENELGTPHDRVALREALSLEDVRQLLDGSLLAVRISRWYSRRDCDQLCRRLLRHPGFSRYSIAPDVGVQRIGYSWFETQSCTERVEDYFDMSVATIRELRDVCAPALTPIDRLRLELDEIWPAGAGVATMDGRKMFAGVARLFEDGHSLEPHQDVLSRETDHDFATKMRAQLTANLYLRPPRSGGELEIWDLMPTAEEAKALYTGRYDFFDRDRLPAPSAVVRPQTGELVVMLSSRVHAVRAGTGGPRISLSCFIGYSGDGERLAFWN